MSASLGLILFAAIEAVLALWLARRGSRSFDTHLLWAATIAGVAVVLWLTEWALS